MLNRPMRPSPSMVVALLALFVALGGTAVAARVLIKSSKQIRNGAVKRADIAKGAVDSTRVANGTLSLDDLDGPARTSIQNAGTQALEAFRSAGPSGLKNKATAKVATLTNIPPGAYAIFAKTVLTATSTTGILGQGNSIGGHCILNAGGDSDESRTLLGSPGANAPSEVTMQITRSYSETGEASVTCDVDGGEWAASNTSIIAIRTGVSPRQVVTGR